MRALLSLLVVAVMAISAEMTMTVDQLVSFVQSSVKNHTSDREVAEYLRHVKMSYRLDDRTVEDLQGSGAGPRTVAALHELRDSSASLPPPPAPKAKAQPPPPQAPPSLQDQGKIIEQAREYALN